MNWIRGLRNILRTRSAPGRLERDRTSSSETSGPGRDEQENDRANRRSPAGRRHDPTDLESSFLDPGIGSGTVLGTTGSTIRTGETPPRSSRRRMSDALSAYPTQVATNQMRARVLQLCNQAAPTAFEEEFPSHRYTEIRRVDCGTYGEVFRARDLDQDNDGEGEEGSGRPVILKVMRAVPSGTRKSLHGLITLKGTITFDDIYNELLISKTLALYHVKGAAMEFHCYPKLFSYKLVRGDMPDYFKHQDQVTSPSSTAAADEKGVDRDLAPLRPEPFAGHGSHIPREWFVMSMKDCGDPLWKVIRHRRLTPEALIGVVYQVIFALWCGEETHQFEHRDLHISNILLRPTGKPVITYRVAGEEFTLDSYGWKVTLIDFSFARMSVGAGESEIVFKYLYSHLKQKIDEYERHMEEVQSRRRRNSVANGSGPGPGPSQAAVGTTDTALGPDGKPLPKLAARKLQDDTYVKMARFIGQSRHSWAGHHPRTNCLWLYYLMKTIIGSKLIKSRLAEDPHWLDGFKQLISHTHEATSTQSVVDMVRALADRKRSAAVPTGGE